MDDAEPLEEMKCLQDLNGESTDEVQRKSSKVRLLDELIEVLTEDFKLKTSMPSEDE